MDVTNVKQSKSNENVEYIPPVDLQDKVQVFSQAQFTRISTGDGEKKIALKIGRYQKKKLGNTYVKMGPPEVNKPKSELTLNNVELESLVSYINQHYYPLQKDETKYISLDNVDLHELVKDNPNNITKLIEVAITEKIDLSDVNKLIEIADRKKAIKEFEKLYVEDATENLWQRWFHENNWVLGSDFIRVSDDRRIDVENIADFIVENMDGFIDVIEIKRPGESASFFESKKDHDNLVPSLTLTKAITQLANYLSALEKKANDVDTQKRIGKILKPRGILIYGNSKTWGDEEKEAFRLLNSSLVNITVLTYNMVHQRAKNMNDYLSNKEIKENNN